MKNPGSSNLLLGRNLVGQGFAGAQHIDRRLILAQSQGVGAQRFRGRFLSSGFRGGKKHNSAVHRTESCHEFQVLRCPRH